LDRVRAKGDWEAWLDFFLRGVKGTAEQSAAAARRILAVFEADHRKIEELGRPAASALRVFEHMQRNPIVSIPTAATFIGISAPTVARIPAAHAAVGHTAGDHRASTPPAVRLRRLPGYLEPGNRADSVSMVPAPGLSR
jgi:hypothetical protein